MITLNVEDYCQNCPDFRPHIYKSRFYNKVMTSISCEDCEKCERIYKSLIKWMGEKKNGRVD